MFKKVFPEPQYHFIPPRGWMNDPNGLIHIDGEYHMFYQYNPDNPFGPALNRIRWGHARSTDLLHWEHLPAAMNPDTPYDGGGVWSGCMVNDGAAATALYTGVSGDIAKRQSQCVATSEDMILWEKYEGNPVIAKPPRGVGSWFFRDPYVWKHEGEWLMAVGASLRGRGAVLLYRSSNLREWEYLGPLHTAGRGEGRMWECPNFFRLDDGSWMLVISVIPWKPVYFVGEFDGRKFRVAGGGPLDFGSCFFAPQVFRDQTGRLLMFGWLREETPLAAASGRQGAMSLPREIAPGGGGRPVIRPAREVKALRGDSVEVEHAEVSPGSPLKVARTSSPVFEIESQIASGGAKKIRMKITGEGNSGGVSIEYNVAKRGLEIKRPALSDGKLFVPMELSDNGTFELNVFIDGTIMELFTGCGSVASCRIYPSPAGECAVKIKSTGGTATINRFSIWDIQRIN